MVPSSSPTVFSRVSVLCISQVHQRIFGSADFEAIHIYCCVGGPAPAWCLCLGEGTSVVYQTVGVASDALHPNPPLHFYKWGNLVPIHICSALLQLNWVIADLGPGVPSLFRWGWAS